MSKVEKFCVFCGDKPNKKTREHIIPQWLIKMTGKASRQINIPPIFSLYISIEEYKQKLGRKFSFNNFTLPACESCNNKYSKLEQNTKKNIRKNFE